MCRLRDVLVLGIVHDFMSACQVSSIVLLKQDCVLIAVVHSSYILQCACHGMWDDAQWYPLLSNAARFCLLAAGCKGHSIFTDGGGPFPFQYKSHRKVLCSTLLPLQVEGA